MPPTNTNIGDKYRPLLHGQRFLIAEREQFLTSLGAFGKHWPNKGKLFRQVAVVRDTATAPFACVALFRHGVVE